MTKPTIIKKPKVQRDKDDYRYFRVGYISRDETTDKLVAQVLAVLPGEGVLPLHWKWINNASFQDRFGSLGTLLWSKTASYHMLMVAGSHVCRIWTNAKHFCIIDVLPTVATVCVSKGLKADKIPDNCLTKAFPMEQRITVSTPEEMQLFIESLVMVHGLKDWMVNNVQDV